MELKINFIIKIRLLIVDLYIRWLNFWLLFFKTMFFYKKLANPKNILIYKVGNIGDIICAVPALINIRKFYPEAKITLLTSPGKFGAPGAKEVLSGVNYIDYLKVYYSNDVDSFGKYKKFVNDLKKCRYDFFIQLPDDLANFRTLGRNLFFAKLIGVKYAIGFKIRTVHIFKKTQVDYLFRKTEVENLIEILRENDIVSNDIKFEFNINANKQKRVDDILKEGFGIDFKKRIIVAISPAGKRDANKWPVERYKELAGYIKGNYNAKFVIIGGQSEFADAEIIKNSVIDGSLNLAGKLDLLETLELFTKCTFLLSNDTGTAHMAAAMGLPVIGIYGVRNIFGSWFPFGENHIILYHKFINCDYMNEACIKTSVNAVSLKEAKNACDQILKNEQKLFKRNV